MAFQSAQTSGVLTGSVPEQMGDMGGGSHSPGGFLIFFSGFNFLKPLVSR